METECPRTPFVKRIPDATVEQVRGEGSFKLEVWSLMVLHVRVTVSLSDVGAPVCSPISKVHRIPFRGVHNIEIDMYHVPYCANAQSSLSASIDRSVLAGVCSAQAYAAPSNMA